MKTVFKDALIRALPAFLAIGLAVILFFCIQRFDGIADAFRMFMRVLTPFIYGGVMAYLLKTPFNFLCRQFKRKMPGLSNGTVKTIALLIVLVATFAAFILLLVMVIPALVRSTISIMNEAPTALDSLNKFVHQYIDNEAIDNLFSKLIPKLKMEGTQWLQKVVLPHLQGMVGGFAATMKSVVGFLFNILLGVIICIYCLLSKETFLEQAKMILYAVFSKEWAKKISDEFVFIDKIFVGFFGGKIMDSIVVGIICYIFCLILQIVDHMPNAVLIAVLVGVTNIIPYFGPFIGAVPSVLLAFMHSPRDGIIMVIFIIILQQFDGNVLGPMLLSGSVGLSGFWVLFSITVFGGLMGFVGILIGVPIFAVIYDLIKRLVYQGLRKRGMEDMIPKPKPKEKKRPKKPFGQKQLKAQKK